MKELATLFAANHGGHIPASQTQAIDVALANAILLDIPEEQTQNVIDYITQELLYNLAPEPIKGKLECLLEELKSRA